MMNSETVNEGVIDTIVKILQKTIDDIEDNETKRKLEKSKEFLEKLKTIEKESYIKDERSISMLDDMLKNI